MTAQVRQPAERPGLNRVPVGSNPTPIHSQINMAR